MEHRRVCEIKLPMHSSLITARFCCACVRFIERCISGIKESISIFARVLSTVAIEVVSYAVTQYSSTLHAQSRLPNSCYARGAGAYAADKMTLALTRVCFSYPVTGAHLTDVSFTVDQGTLVTSTWDRRP